MKRIALSALVAVFLIALLATQPGSQQNATAQWRTCVDQDSLIVTTSESTKVYDPGWLSVAITVEVDTVLIKIAAPAETPEPSKWARYRRGDMISIENHGNVCLKKIWYKGATSTGALILLGTKIR